MSFNIAFFLSYLPKNFKNTLHHFSTGMSTLNTFFAKKISFQNRAKSSDIKWCGFSNLLFTKRDKCYFKKRQMLYKIGGIAAISKWSNYFKVGHNTSKTFLF